MPDLKLPQPFCGVFNAVQPFFRKRTVHPDASTAIKAEVRRILGLDDDTVVMVNEIACCASECPDIETVIAVLRPGGASQPIRIASSIAAIKISTLEQIIVQQTAANPGN
jgi:hypothetical protein